MSAEHLASLPERRANGSHEGITSVCSAHPLVIEAAFLQGLADGSEVLIEATCNQVNQDGGYTGMTPADFRRFVEEIAARVGFPPERLILGGDHLGPNPWKGLDAEAAFAKADVMIAAFVEAGFTKIHLDASMGCAGEPEALDDETTAARAARLAAIAEDAHRRVGGTAPVYIIGTEVPTPGGALEALDHLQVTSPEAAAGTVEVHRRAFSERGLQAAFDRVIGLVVQPGVEFGDADVVHYAPEKAVGLSQWLKSAPQFVFEAHSTDYQTEAGLAALVRDGFAILKVGPWLTFALREALYGLDAIACELVEGYASHSLKAAMEELLLSEPGNWKKYYHGDETALRVKRHYSYSDRIRYYWPHPTARAAVERLTAALDDVAIPETLISQHLGALYPQVVSGEVKPNVRDLQIAAVRNVLRQYAQAC
ncbi:tagatose-bisphosphate aldolase noncatalytic subunit [Faunimonas pinastri]|uniref:Tagatose-bisphosphate aldolase noncatalytic subunit n=1 Tax=Faunimonas pinastri TaxID=1855383 RepID=A0A1H9NXQ1_9HYPH|nr:D-tagatose-bisphosphate aldolase, class II, non-catalytic subunit [Faunimonas pinastri]SER40113.1 tagatose-bisphosphate aldolase noncatalytic subunit [Faunimonas pinastri]